ncbi:PLP-dependent aminotransferase family protein [Sinomonas sp. JGH33]|uniref:PLP-dependent aminotransferase family protein n=1 Tax=Sinomonas terricola TaxID=3110330 RepID=A0ABU5T838_9MICC|nr:PLP-dependent aminotransferase family protein [Sinomonas sp. JGH33]MEA5455768.1 PLP-dependent aminotransferase family protein [Sinomonas sp. JGH33]
MQQSCQETFEIALSDRAKAGRPSEVRKVFRAAQRPGIISFANGAPFLGALPFDKLAEEARRILAEQGGVALQYGASDGIPRLRKHIVDVMALEGVTAHPDRVIVTAGSQQALNIAAHATINPGDVVFAEGPSYAGGMSVLTSHEAEVVHVPSDGDGLIPSELERLIDEARAAGKTPKVLYTIPNFQNPGGMNLSPERRIKIGHICRKNGMLLFEDNPYGLLGFDGQTMPAIQPEFPDITFYFGSFSKMFAPGLRLGWVIAPDSIHDQLVNIAETAALNPAVFNQLIMAAYLDDAAWKDTLDVYRGIYKAKFEALVETLAEVMPPGCTWNRPTGGFYLWVKVPDGIDTEELVWEAIERGIVYVPGTAFYTNGAGHSELRLSFCLPSIQDIRKGAAILGELLREALAIGHLHTPDRETEGKQLVPLGDPPVTME